MTRKCPICKGEGRSSGFDWIENCAACEGSGVQGISVDEEGKYTVDGPRAPGELHGECPDCGGVGIVMDPQHGASQKCEPCSGRGTISHKICEVHLCQGRAGLDRKICDRHAFPAARPKGTTGRRAAVLATRKKIAEEAKVSESITDAPEEETNP